jgi:hypothetical protein
MMRLYRIALPRMSNASRWRWHKGIEVEPIEIELACEA